jgi:hypothetical protein
MGSGNLRGCAAWVGNFPGSVTTPNFDGIALPPAISVVRRAQLTFRPALQSAASLALQSAHMYDGYQPPAASGLGGDVNFRLRQAVRAQLKGGSILLCLLD